MTGLFKEMEDRGKFVLATFVIDGQDKKMSVWDDTLKSVVKGMSLGQSVELDVKVKGDFTNCVGIDGVRQQYNKPATSTAAATQPAPGKAGQGGDEMRRHPDVMTLISILQGLIEAGKINSPEDLITEAYNYYPSAKVINAIDKDSRAGGESVPF